MNFQVLCSPATVDNGLDLSLLKPLQCLLSLGKFQEVWVVTLTKDLQDYFTHKIAKNQWCDFPGGITQNCWSRTHLGFCTSSSDIMRLQSLLRLWKKVQTSVRVLLASHILVNICTVFLAQPPLHRWILSWVYIEITKTQNLHVKEREGHLQSVFLLFQYIRGTFPVLALPFLIIKCQGHWD